MKPNKIAAKVNRALDQMFHGPNLYKILLDKGLDDVLANEVQEIFLEHEYECRHKALDAFTCEFEKILNKAEKMGLDSSKYFKKTEALLNAMDRV
jgi:hypothetical protein